MADRFIISGRLASGAWARYTADSYGEALEIATEHFGAAVVGHDGDLTDYGERTLGWASEEEARDDDGARAVCVIIRADDA